MPFAKRHAFELLFRRHRQELLAFAGQHCNHERRRPGPGGLFTLHPASRERQHRKPARLPVPDHALAEAVDTESATAWREGRLVFKGRELDDVLAQLGRYHQVDLVLADAKLRHLKVSGSFPTGDLDLALNTIAASLPVKVARRDAGHIALEAEGRLRPR